jgi:23S rRNA-/tRNA-specific pseudouridylate synthase
MANSTPSPLEILYEDNHCLAVAKPFCLASPFGNAGVAVPGDARYHPNTWSNLALSRHVANTQGWLG